MLYAKASSESSYQSRPLQNLGEKTDILSSIDHQNEHCPGNRVSITSKSPRTLDFAVSKVDRHAKSNVIISRTQPSDPQPPQHRYSTGIPQRPKIV
jgi:hypothetical protein